MNGTEFQNRVFQKISDFYIVSVFNGVVLSLGFCTICGLIIFLRGGPVFREETENRARELRITAIRQENRRLAREERDLTRLEEPPPPYASVVSSQ